MQLGFLLLILAFFLSSCAGGVGGMGVNPAIDGGAGGNEKHKTVNDGSTGEKGMPVVDLPAPSNKALIAYGNDSEYNTPIAGKMEAGTFNAGDRLVVSTDELHANNSLWELDWPRFAKAKMQKHWGKLVNSAIAMDGNADVAFDPNQLPDDAANICLRENTFCCPDPIAADGSVVCYYPSGQSVDRLHIARLTPNGELSNSISKKVNENLHWTVNAPQDIVSGPMNFIDHDGVDQQDVAFSLVNEKLVTLAKIQENNRTRLAVQGLYQQDYEEDNLGAADKLAYNPAGNILASKKSAEGVDLKNIIQQAAAGQNQNVDIGLWSRPNEVESYNILKVAGDGKMRVAGRMQPGVLPLIFDIRADNLAGENPAIVNTISYFSDLRGRREVATADNFETNAFDTFQQGSTSCATAIYQYQDNGVIAKKLRIYCKNRDLNRIAKMDQDIPAETTFGDINFYHTSLEPNSPFIGKAIVVEKNGDSLWTVEFESNPLTINQKPIILNVIPLDEKPKDLALNAMKTKVFVVTENDNLISLDLATLNNNGQKQFLDANSIIRSKTERNLGDLLPEENAERENNLKINPTSISLKKVGETSHLLIGSQNLKGIISIPVDEIRANH